LNPDFLDLLAALVRADARFLVVGAHAMAAHGVPRATGDLDVWIQPDEDNAGRVWEALIAFGAPVQTLGLSQADLVEPAMVFQMGEPPRRIDVLTSITGVDFDEAWVTRSIHRVGEIDVPFLGRAALLANKRATGRTKDLADVEILERPERQQVQRKRHADEG